MCQKKLTRLTIGDSHVHSDYLLLSCLAFCELVREQTYELHFVIAHLIKLYLRGLSIKAHTVYAPMDQSCF